MKIDFPHVLTIEEVLIKTGSVIDSGLTQIKAEKRLIESGPNEIESGEKVSALQILFENVHNIIVYLLMLASGVAFIMGDPVEGFAVIAAIIIAVASGFLTEYKAQKSIESLQQLVKTTAKVKRDSTLIEIESSKLVVGDVVFMEEGDSITADARIIESRNFASVESALTGEAEAVDKDPDFTGEEDTPIGDRKNMVYTGTAAARGNAYAIVTGTGMNTELGKISSLLKKNKKAATPLEEQLHKLGKTLILFAAFVALIVTITGIVTGEEISFMIKIGIILAIAAVPEALPAVSTITLAIGMRTMASHNALVKSLPAVETLGSTTVICTDKTGTLTENQMTVKQLYLAGHRFYEVEGSGYQPAGKFLYESEEIQPSHDKELTAFIRAGVLSSNAAIAKEGKEYKVIGDPTEGGIVIMGKKASIERNDLEKNGYRRIGEIPFSSKEKYMATAYENNSDKMLFIKGAPDVLMDMSGAGEEQKKEWLKVNDQFAEKGMRVLAVGVNYGYDGDGTEYTMKEFIKKGITLLGFVGIIDPPREDVGQAIKEAQEAGIRIIMITGDHPKTAKIIAHKIGMEKIEDVITGREMDKMSEDEMADAILTTSIFARVSPENKLQIVNALNKNQEVTAMTGDGVNDAPALNGANIGVAMGIRGTEVAKDASDMILTDDRFSTIVDAVKEGRVIFDNIEKFVYFLFSCNVVEILAVFITIIFRLPIPLLGLQILWLNLVVDVFPAMSLAWEPAESGVMKRKPRDPQQAILNRSFLVRILSNGTMISLGSLAAFIYALNQGYAEETARTMAFTAMALGQLFHLFNVREKQAFGINKSLFKNRYLILALFASFILQVIAVYLPFFNIVMGTTPLNLLQWFVTFLGAIIPTVLIQAVRYFKSMTPVSPLGQSPD